MNPQKLLTVRGARIAVCALVLGAAGALARPNALFHSATKQDKMPSTRDLFHYVRDDHSPGNVTRVHIDVRHKALQPIHPFVFGNFLEHLGGTVYEGVWGQVLLNPNLEPENEGDREPPNWRLRDAAWQEGGYLSPRCVRLSALTAITAPTDAADPVAEADRGLTQTIALPAYRTRRYSAQFYARAPEGAGEITLSIRGVGAKAGRSLAQVHPHVLSAEWTRYAFPLEIPQGALAKGEEARFQIVHRSGRPVDVDQVELFPDDNIDGLDHDVLARSRDWHIPVLRFPGGNFVSGYHWRDGIGPTAARPTRRNAAWGGIEPNHFGPDEALKFCRLIGAKPQIGVNAGDGTPEEAADWVRYCNAPITDPLGKLRADNGHQQPYGVSLWEVGNELYGGWQIGHTDAAGNAERFVRFREAMLQADPSLSLIATGKGEEFTPAGLQRDRDWNERLLRAAVANGGRPPDYLSIHPLVPLPGGLGGFSYADRYDSAFAHPTFLNDTLLPDLARLILSVEGPDAQTRIAPTEWGIIVGGDRWWEGPNHDVLAGALFNALTLNTFLRNSDWVTLANMTALTHGGGIKKPRGVVTVDPQYWTQKLYADAGPHTPVETTATGPGRDCPARGFLPAVAHVPDVDVFAALKADPHTLLVFAVNQHRLDARPLRLEIEGFAAASITGTILTAPDLQARNTIEAPDTVRPRPFPTPAWPSPEKTPWQVSLPPHSLVVLSLHQH